LIRLHLFSKTNNSSAPARQSRPSSELCILLQLKTTVKESYLKESLLSVNSVIRTESCTCHHGSNTDLYGGGPYAKGLKNQFFRNRYGPNVKSCPLSGCRAADWANGKWLKMVEGLFAVATVKVEFSLTADSDPPERASIVRNFTSARSHISLTSKIKFCTWSHLPLRCAGIADPDQALAREADWLMAPWRDHGAIAPKGSQQ
jgi:hypothetical protein